jgi:hypothetical protein
MKVSQEDFTSIAIECDLDPVLILSTLKKRFPTVEHRPSKVVKRLESFRLKGLLPLASGNAVSYGEILKGSSTLYDANGNIKQQWVKTDVPKQAMLNQFNEAIENIIEKIPAVAPTIAPSLTPESTSLMSVYTIGDAHVGMLSWAPETGDDNDLLTVQSDLEKAMNTLVSQSLPTKEAFIVDVGDFYHADNASNTTSKSGNNLDVDGRYAKVLEVGLYLATRLIDMALQKHELVRWRSAIGELVAT